MDIQTFKTKSEAQAEMATMSHWTVKVTRRYLPGDKNANRNGNVWVIEASGHGDPHYLMTDGFVR